MGTKPDGRRDRRHREGATRAEVLAKVRELERQRDGGVVNPVGKAPTVAEWLTHWLDNIAARKVRLTTLRRYRGLVEHQIVPAIGGYRLDKLTPEHVEALHAEMLTTGLSASSRMQAHRVLSRALKVATQRGKVARNVCALLDAPSVERAEVQPLTRDEARRVIEAAASLRNGTRWLLALALGLRQGEALGVQWQDIDPDAGTLRVRRQLQRYIWQHGCDQAPCGRKRAAECPWRHGGGLVLTTPKSRAGNRTITLPAPLVKALREHRAAQAAERLAAGSAWSDNDMIFATITGGMLDPRADNREWKALLEAAGVREARLHDARHTAATVMLALGGLAVRDVGHLFAPRAGAGDRRCRAGRAGLGGY